MMNIDSSPNLCPENCVEDINSKSYNIFYFNFNNEDKAINNLKDGNIANIFDGFFSNDRRELQKRNSTESLLNYTDRERPLDRSRNYEIWVYPDEIYPFYQDEQFIDNNIFHNSEYYIPESDLLGEINKQNDKNDEATGRNKDNE